MVLGRFLGLILVECVFHSVVSPFCLTLIRKLVRPSLRFV